ncbi:MAG: Hsp70 family protein, partial [Williamsia herbipolensis]|nr:Hsp70 family protein [Williamsia herbipolensis]
MLGIDLGTSNTVAAITQPGRPPRVLSIDGAGWLPSAVFLDESGQLVVGRDAERRARLAPERFEPNPKRRIDDGEVMLGSAVVPVVAVIAAVLRRVGEETRRQNAGRPADVVTLTHPATWGSTRRNVLYSAARMADLGSEIALVAEPVAAAVHFAGRQSDHDGPAHDQALAVYDLGGGTVDCAVVVVQDGRYRVAASEGLSDVGGVDFDQALLEQIGRSAATA